MKFHISAYTAALGVNAANTDVPFATDTVLLARNGHLITTEQLLMRQAFYMAASATDARFDSPSLASPSRMHIAPAQRSAVVLTRPYGIRLIDRPLTLPMNEEIAVQGSNNLGAATEQSNAFVILTPPTWNGQNLKGVPLNPQGPSEFIIKATSTVVVSASAWGGGSALVFSESLKGGWYAIRAAQLVAAGCLAFRFIFPRQMAGARRPWRPGSIGSQAIGDTPEEYMWTGQLGDWGYFHAFEPPAVEVFSNSGGATAATLFIALTFLGDNPPAGIV